MFQDLRNFAQAVANQFMETEVTIKPRNAPGKDPTNPYGDDSPTYGDPFTVKGWFISSLTKNLNSVGGLTAAVEDDTIRLPVGTSVKSGDKLIFNGNEWAAIDASDDDTWPAMLKVAVSRISGG